MQKHMNTFLLFIISICLIKITFLGVGTEPLKATMAREDIEAMEAYAGLERTNSEFVRVMNYSYSPGNPIPLVVRCTNC